MILMLMILAVVYNIHIAQIILFLLDTGYGPVPVSALLYCPPVQPEPEKGERSMGTEKGRCFCLWQGVGEGKFKEWAWNRKKEECDAFFCRIIWVPTFVSPASEYIAQGADTLPPSSCTEDS